MADETRMADLAQRLVSLDARKQELQTKLSDVITERTDVEERLTTVMQEAGITQLRVEYEPGKQRSVYFYRQFRPKVLDRPLLVQKIGGHADTKFMLSVNHQTLGAWIRELPTDPDTGFPTIPKRLRSSIEVEDFIALRTRKA